MPDPIKTYYKLEFINLQDAQSQLSKLSEEDAIHIELVPKRKQAMDELPKVLKILPSSLKDLSLNGISLNSLKIDNFRDLVENLPANLNILDLTNTNLQVIAEKEKISLLKKLGTFESIKEVKLDNNAIKSSPHIPTLDLLKMLPKKITELNLDAFGLIGADFSDVIKYLKEFKDLKTLKIYKNTAKLNSFGILQKLLSYLPESLVRLDIDFPTLYKTLVEKQIVNTHFAQLDKIHEVFKLYLSVEIQQKLIAELVSFQKRQLETRLLSSSEITAFQEDILHYIMSVKNKYDLHFNYPKEELDNYEHLTLLIKQEEENQKELTKKSSSDTSNPELEHSYKKDLMMSQTIIDACKFFQVQTAKLYDKIEKAVTIRKSFDELISEFKKINVIHQDYLVRLQGLEEIINRDTRPNISHHAVRLNLSENCESQIRAVRFLETLPNTQITLSLRDLDSTPRARDDSENGFFWGHGQVSSNYSLLFEGNFFEKIDTLDLSFNKIGQMNFDHLLVVLKKLPSSLKVLNLTNNFLDHMINAPYGGQNLINTDREPFKRNEGYMRLIMLLEILPTSLTEIKLEGNGFSKKLISALLNEPSIVKIPAVKTALERLNNVCNYPVTGSNNSFYRPADKKAESLQSLDPRSEDSGSTRNTTGSQVVDFEDNQNSLPPRP